MSLPLHLGICSMINGSQFLQLQPAAYRNSNSSIPVTATVTDDRGTEVGYGLRDTGVLLWSLILKSMI